MPNQPVDAPLALQILHACCDIHRHPDQHLGRQVVALVAQEGEKIATLWRRETNTHTLKREELSWRVQWSASLDSHPGWAPWWCRWAASGCKHQSASRCWDGCSASRSCTADSGCCESCVHACKALPRVVRVRATWLPSGTCSSARVPGSPCRSSQLQQCYCVVKGRCTLLQSSPVYVCVRVMGTTTQSVVVTATAIFHCTDCAAELRATSDWAGGTEEI